MPAVRLRAIESDSTEAMSSVLDSSCVIIAPRVEPQPFMQPESSPRTTRSGFRFARLTLADAPELQALYERCTDYHMAHEGTPTRANAGEEELTSLPPGRSAEDKFPFGIYSPDADLAGYLELFRNYPAEGEWWIGLLMLDPQLRRRGLGSDIFRSASEWAAENGARAIQLAVLQQDAAARRFWQRQGFELLRHRPYRSQAENKAHTVLVLRRELAAGETAAIG
jgi:GNAT superfamily N-acetyltransferase